MAVTNTPAYTQGIFNQAQTIVNADGTSAKALTTSQTNGVRIYSIIVSSSDTSAKDVILYATISATNYPLIQVQIPITAGLVNTTPPVNLLRGGNLPGQFPGLAFDSNGNPYFDLAAGTTLSISAPGTVTAAKQINIFVQGGPL